MIQKTLRCAQMSRRNVMSAWNLMDSPQPTNPSSLDKDFLRGMALPGTIALLAFIIITALGAAALLHLGQPWLIGIFFAALLVYLVSTLRMISRLYLKRAEYEQSQPDTQILVQRYLRRTAQFEMAGRVARDAIATLELEPLLEGAARLIHERFQFYHCGIFLIDEGTHSAVLRAVAGTTPGSAALLRRKHVLRVGSDSVIGVVTATGKPLTVIDVHQDTVHLTNPLLPSTVSELALPLVIRDRIIGALDVQHNRTLRLEPEDMDILQLMADQLAGAIEMAQLKDKMQGYATLLEERVAQRTAELADQRAQLSTILDTMTEGVIYTHQLELRYINQSFTQITGYDASNWHGFLDLIQISAYSEPEALAIYNRIFEAIMRQGRWEGELLLRRADGVEFDAHITGTRIQLEGQSAGTVTVIRDISQERALQEQKTRFVAYASHELRTPLTNLKTRLYLMEKQPHRFQDHFQVIRSVTARMQQLVDDLLDQSRFDRGRITLNRQLGDLRALTLETVAVQRPEAEQRRLSLSVVVPDAPCMAYVDPLRITQVLTNLLINAINYTPEKGCIEVALRCDDGCAFLAVRDTGVGIAPEMLTQIFQPFVRGSNHQMKGTGLGLNIAKQIVELHQGEIEVSSEPGAGALFTVRLPLQAPVASIS